MSTQPNTTTRPIQVAYRFDPCPECGGFDSTLWADSGPGWDEWSCRCGHQWAIPIHEPTGR